MTTTFRSLFVHAAPFFRLRSLCYVSISFLLLSLMVGLIEESAYGAQVKRKLRKRTVVVVDGGKNLGLKQGDPVCFFDNSKVKVACGIVNKVQSYRSFIKVARADLPLIKRGMTAAHGEELKALVDDQTKLVSFGVAGFINLYPLYKMTSPIYVDDQPPYWKGNNNSAYVYPQFKSFTHPRAAGPIFEVKVPRFNTMIGARYDIAQPGINRWAPLPFEPAPDRYKDNEDCAPYTDDSGQKYNTGCYAELGFKDSSWGLWLQYLHPIAPAKDIEYSFGGGLDYNMSKLVFNYNQISDHVDTNDSFKNYRLVGSDTQFVLYSLALRLVPSRVTVFVSKSLGVYFELAAIFGFYKVSSSVKGNRRTGDRNVEYAGGDQFQVVGDYIPKYFADALNHRPGIGSTIHLGVEYGF